LTRGEANAVLVILNTQEYCEATSFRSQIGIFCRQLDQRRINLSFKTIGKIFGCSPGNIKYHSTRYSSIINPVGRPKELTNQEIEKLKEEIKRKIANKDPPTYQYLLNWLSEELEKSIYIDTLRHIIHRELEFKVVTGVPLERSRIQVDIKDIEEYFESIKPYVETIPSSFIFNLDETGFLEFQDATDIKVIVSADFQESKINIPVNRDSKRSTLLHGICADGSFIPPCIILPRKTIETETFNCGLTPEKVLLLYQINGFMTNSCFDLWFHQIFIPQIKKKKRELSYNGESLLIMD